MVIVIVVPASVAVYIASGREAGPRSTEPSIANSEPWHPHSMRCADAS